MSFLPCFTPLFPSLLPPFLFSFSSLCYLNLSMLSSPFPSSGFFSPPRFPILSCVVCCVFLGSVVGWFLTFAFVSVMFQGCVRGAGWWFFFWLSLCLCVLSVCNLLLDSVCVSQPFCSCSCPYSHTCGSTCESFCIYLLIIGPGFLSSILAFMCTFVYI